MKQVYLQLIYLRCMKKYNKKWLMELISISKSDAGGLKEVIASIKGNNIYSSLKFESGFIEYKEFQKLKHKESTYISCYSGSFTRGRGG